MKKHPLILLLLLPILLLPQGCRTAVASSGPDRNSLHGPPLTMDGIVTRSGELPAAEVATEARLRGLAFEWNAEASTELASKGVSPTLLERLDDIARDPNPLGRHQSRPGDAPLVILGTVGVLAALVGAGFLIAEAIDDGAVHTHHHGDHHHR